MKFPRHASHRKARVSKAWRRPRGLHNKLRLQKKGHGKLVKEGYRSPVETRGKRKGLEIVRVENVGDLEGLDAKTQGVLIANIGAKKKLAVLEAIEKKKLTLFTGDPAEERKALEERMKRRQAAAQERKDERTTKKEAAKKEAAKDSDKDKLEEKVESEDPEGKSPEEKQKEKVLTKAR